MIQNDLAKTLKRIQKNGLKVDFTGKGSPTNVAQGFSSILNSKEIVFFPSSNKSLGTVQSIIDNRNKIIVETYQTFSIDRRGRSITIIH